MQPTSFRYQHWRYRDQGKRSTSHITHCRRDQSRSYRIRLVYQSEKQDGNYMWRCFVCYVSRSDPFPHRRGADDRYDFFASPRKSPSPRWAHVCWPIVYVDELGEMRESLQSSEFVMLIPRSSSCPYKYVLPYSRRRADEAVEQQYFEKRRMGFFE
jgi:hypothetical protein